MITKVFLLWRLGLLIITILGSLVFTLAANGAIGAIAPGKEFSYWYSLAQWDGGYFYTIARDGYFANNPAFFPLFPLATKALSLLIFNNTLLAGLLISNIAFLLFLYVTFDLARLTFGKGASWPAVITYLTFPTTYFAVSFYSESIFLLFVALTFLFLKKNNLFKASIAAGLATATRFVGVFLIIPILFAVAASIRKNPTRNWYQIFYLPLSVLGLTLYALYLKLKFGDPLFFANAQSIWWHRTFQNPISTIYSYLSSNPFDRPFNDHLDVTLTIAFILIIIAGIKKIPFSWALYALFTILIPASTGTLTSMPRYLLATFPAFLLIGDYLATRKKLAIFVWGISLCLQLALAIMFINGHWTA